MKYCLITDRKYYASSLPEVASQAEAAGVDFFQLREKDLPVRELLELASRIRAVLLRTIFIVNGSVDVALASKADGVHLQKDNIPVRAVREKHRNLMIGYSAHSYDEMIAAAEAGVNYVFISPVFAPGSKKSELVPLGPAVIGSWSNSISVPVFALGGISPRNVAMLKSAGCTGIAGISFFAENGLFTSKGMVV